jgi:hypothetical protein
MMESDGVLFIARKRIGDNGKRNDVELWKL